MRVLGFRARRSRCGPTVLGLFALKLFCYTCRLWLLGGEGGGEGEGAGDNNLKASCVPFLEAHRREFGIGHRRGESVSFYSVS